MKRLTGSSELEQTVAFDDGTHKSLTGGAITLLRRKLIAGHYLPDSKLKISDIAQELGISSGLVREALSRLVAEGLVVFNDQRGFRASSISETELIDITRTRILIDTAAIELAIQNGNADWEASILAAHHRLERCQRLDPASGSIREEWSALHREFHKSLIASCQSSWLLRLHDLLFDQSERYRRLRASYDVSSSVAKKRNVEAEHRELIDAVISRDTKLAQQKITDHYETTAERILEMENLTSIAAQNGTKLENHQS